MFVSVSRASLRTWPVAVALVGLTIAFTACGGSQPAAPAEQAPAATAPGGQPAPATPGESAEEPLPTPAFETELPDGVQALLARTFSGDFDEMVKRRMIRVGVTFNRTFYFVDQGVQRGVSYEYCKLFEDELNKQLKTGNTKIHVVFVPLPRDLLLPGLVNGKVDLVVAQLTITPDRQKAVDFASPTRTNVREVVVTGPGAPAIASVEDLSGQEVYVRKTSSYYQSLLALNEKLKAQRKPLVSVQAASENLEDDELLEMVNAGLIPIIVVDDYLAEFWKKVFTNLTVHDTVAVRTGGSLAPALRKNSPQLAAAVNAFTAKYGLGTAFGNMIEKRYLVSTKFAKNATSEAERKKFQALVTFFRKYSDQYRLDYLLMAAQGYQESQLDQNAKSPVGAIGIMQVMPATGQELNVGDITKIEPNIHAGVKYIRYMVDSTSRTSRWTT